MAGDTVAQFGQIDAHLRPENDAVSHAGRWSMRPKNSSIQVLLKPCGESHMVAPGWYFRRLAVCFSSRAIRYFGSVWPGSPPGTNTASTRGSWRNTSPHSRMAAVTVEGLE